MPGFSSVTKNPSAKTTAIAAVVVATTAALWAKRQSNLRRKRRANRQDGCVKVKLLPNENSFVIKTSPSTSSITFFEAKSQEEVDAARAYFEERSKAIVDANPWLTGFLDIDDADDKAGNLALFVPHGDKKCDGSSSFAVLDTLGALPEDYHTMVQALGQAVVGNTVEHVASVEKSSHGCGDKSWEPLWRVAFVPDTGNSCEGAHKFGLVVSANHSLLDGHGYYKLFRMLSCKESITSLSPVRRHDLADSIKAATGKEPSFLEEPSLGFVLSFIASVIRNSVFPQTKSIAFVVSKDWIKEQKETYRKAIKATPDDTPSDSPPPPPAFVSTNDIVVSRFCQETRCDLALMAINLRGRAEGCTENLVGNYEHLLGYCKQDYAAPELIRRSVSGPVYERVGASIKDGQRLPTNLQHVLGCTYAAITSWATFASELRVSTECDNNMTVQQTLHLPLFDFPQATPACTYSSMVIFKPREGEVGILSAGMATLMEKLNASGMAGSMLYEPR